MSLDSGIGTKREFALVDLACARAAAVMSGGVWTFEGDNLVRIFAPEVMPGPRRKPALPAWLAELFSADRVNANDCDVRGCGEPFQRNTHRLCVTHFNRWVRAGKPEIAGWILTVGGAA